MDDGCLEKMKHEWDAQPEDLPSRYDTIYEAYVEPLPQAPSRPQQPAAAPPDAADKPKAKPEAVAEAAVVVAEAEAGEVLDQSRSVYSSSVLFDVHRRPSTRTVPSQCRIDDYSTELEHGVYAPLSLSQEGSSKKGRRPRQRCFPSLLETSITTAEASAHRKLSMLASIPLDEANPEHRRGMEQYWHLMLGDDVPYERRSPRWSDDLGFQSHTPWTDFRGGGLLALRCLLFMADCHNEVARRLCREARYDSSRSWYPFSPAGITICQMLAVHLRLNAVPSVGPIRKQPVAHTLALKRFVRDLAQGDPVEIFANYWLTAFMKLHTEWMDLCARDPSANVLVSFNRVYRNVGIAIERALGTRKKNRLKLLTDVDTRSRMTAVRNEFSRSESIILTNAVKVHNCCFRFRRYKRESSPEPPEERNGAEVSAINIHPPESVKAPEIYQLYRGTAGNVEGYAGRCWIWVDFPSMQLSVADFNLPAQEHMRVSLFDITRCECEEVDIDDTRSYLVNIYSTKLCRHVEGLGWPSARKVTGSSESLREWAEKLQQLLHSRDTEGHGTLMFIQRRLFQYLWRNQVEFVSEEKLYEAQAVLAFNLEPKEGITYLRSKLRRTTDDEVGEWLSEVCNNRGGLDPTMLGVYFSRKDTLPVFMSFVRRIDFGCLDIVHALRQLFDTFKPGGEGQVITRILESFAESYFQHWQCNRDIITPTTQYKSADSVERIAVSLIMLNTGIHVVTQKRAGKRGPLQAAMTTEEYIANTRSCVSAEEVPDDALRVWYEDVKASEISVEPKPRVPFAKLPVQPDVEGWLIVVISPQAQLRYWAVLALRRLYLFTDKIGVFDPEDAIDLSDVTAIAVADDVAARARFKKDLEVKSGAWFSRLSRKRRKQGSAFVTELLANEDRALEIVAKKSLVKLKSCEQPRKRISFVAESRELTEKWVNLISG